jgi:hypothetical protein
LIIGKLGIRLLGSGGVGGLLKTVERSLMTFPDAHILLYLMIYIIKVYKFIQRVPPRKP